MVKLKFLLSDGPRRQEGAGQCTSMTNERPLPLPHTSLSQPSRRSPISIILLLVT